MPSLNNLPVELVLKILNGASLEDILNVTRTCTFLRSIGGSNRSLWAAQDAAHRLPFPMGQTLDTVPLLSMSTLAARAIAISAVWDGAVAHPRRVSYTVPNLCPPKRLSRTHTYSFLPVHGIILPGNQWLLLEMHTDVPRMYCLATGESFPLVVEGRIFCYAYESSHNGSSITLALMKTTDYDYEDENAWFLDVYVLQFDPQGHFRTVPRVRRALSIRILTRANFTPNIDLKGPLVVVTVGNTLHIANWQDHSGVMLTPHLPLEEEQISQPLWKAYFHPELALLIAEDLQEWKDIHVISCPAVLHPFDFADLTDQNLVWPRELLVGTVIHILDVFALGPATHRSFRRRRGREPLVLDLVRCYRESLHNYDRETDRKTDEDWHLTISDMETHRPEMSCCEVEVKRQVFERHTTAGSTICLGIHDSEYPSDRWSQVSPQPIPIPRPPTWILEQVGKSVKINNSSTKETTHPEPICPQWLYFLRMPESGQKATWVRLGLPDGMMLQGISPITVLAFDDVYGTLLMDDEKGNYFIVQY